MIYRLKKLVFGLALLFATSTCFPNDGYKLWLDYKKVENPIALKTYQDLINNITLYGTSKTTEIIHSELSLALPQLLGHSITFNATDLNNGLVLGAAHHLPDEIKAQIGTKLNAINTEGFLIKSLNIKGKNIILISGHTDIGTLYGMFSFLRLLQTEQPISNLNILDEPKINIRTLNHWDNLDRTIERGYSGFSIWNWHTLPDYIDGRYLDYARANASIGINSTVLTNVNANAWVLTPQYLEKVKALADTFRPYGIKVFLTARFSAPIEIGNLKTADPLDPDVIKWWSEKVKEIYDLIPDFGGFLVKANSEGQPGPQDYGRDHVDGANMVADALAPHNGVVMWRAFVYSEHNAMDRAKQAYTEFVPRDGDFRDNVIIQVKNGAIDFQPREPFHPMFGAMPKTNVMMEFMITQEYMGQGTHLVFQPKLFQEVLESDTYCHGKGSTVAKVIDGSLDHKKITGIAGVSNVGNDRNWTGHHFLQANWYGFGRLAWDPYMDSGKIAEEWLRMTFSNEKEFVTPLQALLIKSRETVVNYMTPYGLHHIMATNHHYGPGPWVNNLSRPEWNPVYYHKADEKGIGFDRTPSGSNATEQYAPEVASIYNDLETCPENHLLWFHHVPWNHELDSGRILWDAMAIKYQEGVDEVKDMMNTWESVKDYVDPQRHEEVKMMLTIQYKEAQWWRDACLSYFQQFSKRDLPKEVEKPSKTLDYYKSLRFPYAPGIRPQW